MKIGILTFHRTQNFGAMLQAYALKAYLDSEGHHVKFIDYWPEYHAGSYRLRPARLRRRSFPGKIRYLIQYGLFFYWIRKRYLLCRHFQNERLDLKYSKPFGSIKEMDDQLDLVICGSDQIWRYNTFTDFKGFDSAYFGDMPITCAKIAYAASMGILVYEADRCKNLEMLIGHFDAIAVREKDLQNYLLEQCGIEPEHVMDPIFLLPPDQWQKALKIQEAKSKQILVYEIGAEASGLRKKAKELADQTGLPLKYIRGSVLGMGLRGYPGSAVSPLDFLKQVVSSEYVVTSSFHGVAFSIHFGKQFWAFGVNVHASRITSLLTTFELEGRFIDLKSNIRTDQPIDYNRVRRIKEAWIEKSKNFLVHAINIYGKNK